MPVNLEKILYLLLIFILSACATTGAGFHPAPKAPQGNALVYIMHSPGRYADVWATDIFLDDRKIVSLDDQQYSWLHLPAGTYKFSVYAEKQPLDVPVTLQDGEVVYLELKQKRTSSASFNLAFEKAEKRDAQVRIVDYKYQKSLFSR